MPHLCFRISESLGDSEVGPFVDRVTELYADVMDTGTGHVAVTVRDDDTLTLGRADPGEVVAVLDADIRAGRSAEQRRELATAIIDELADRWGVPAANTYVVYTEHPGEDFHLEAGPLASWSVGEGGGDDNEDEDEDERSPDAG
jgi:phenylpyruvate tautomerase PptA (4-oxalocrotonate tautomerase family)